MGNFAPPQGGSGGGGFANPMTTPGDMISGGAGGTAQRLSAGTANQVLTIVGGVPTWANASSGFANPMTTSQDLIVGGVGGAAGRLGVGSNTQVLTVTGGVVGWAAATGFANPMTAAGDIIVGGSAGAATRLAASTNGFVLTLVAGAPAWQAAGSGGFSPGGTLAQGSHLIGTSGAAYQWAPGPLNMCAFAGVDPTGATDSSAGILAALTASLQSGIALYTPSGLYQINASVSTAGISSAITEGWQWTCDAGAVFVPGAGLGANPMFNLVPPTGKLFGRCRLQLGKLMAPNATLLAGSGFYAGMTTGQHGVRMSNWTACWIYLSEQQGWDTGVFFDQSANTAPFGDNFIFIQEANHCNNGVVASSPAGGNTFTGNQVFIGDLIRNNIYGISVDPLGGSGDLNAPTSAFNRIVIDSAELNGNASGGGILDNCGTNVWQVNNTNSNRANNAFELGATILATHACGIPEVKGVFTEAAFPFTLHGHPAFIVNTPKGALTGTWTVATTNTSAAGYQQLTLGNVTRDNYNLAGGTGGTVVTVPITGQWKLQIMEVTGVTGTSNQAAYSINSTSVTAGIATNSLNSAGNVISNATIDLQLNQGDVLRIFYNVTPTTANIVQGTVTLTYVGP